jgi:pyrophosphatase PpaX
MLYKAVIFDLEGTLTCTPQECVRKIVRPSFAYFGKEISDEDILRFWFDYRRENMIKEHGIEIPEFWKIYREHDTLELRKEYTIPYADADFLHEMKKGKIKIGIVTGSPIRMIEFQIELLGKNNIDAVLRAQLTSHIKPKPNPDGFHKCLEILGYEKEHSLVVGNGDEDILGGRAAGIQPILIDRGEHDLAKEKPFMKINSLYELRDFLDL